VTEATPDEGQIFLSEKRVQQWKDEYIRLLGEQRTLAVQSKELQNKQTAVNNQINEIGHKLRSAIPFSPPLSEWMTEQEIDRGENIPLTTAILKSLLRVPVGHRMNRMAVQQTVPQLGYSPQKLQATPNYLHIALKRLLERKLIIENPAGSYLLTEAGRAEAVK
jgi:hypothetical protein